MTLKSTRLCWFCCWPVFPSSCLLCYLNSPRVNSAQLANMMKDCTRTSQHQRAARYSDSKCPADKVTHTHLAIACAASLVLSFSVFGGGVALGAVASLLPTSCPAGQWGGGLADRPLPTRMLCFGRPLEAWHGGRGDWLLFLLQRPLRPGENNHCKTLRLQLTIII